MAKARVVSVTAGILSARSQFPTLARVILDLRSVRKRLSQSFPGSGVPSTPVIDPELDQSSTDRHAHQRGRSVP